MQLRYEQDLIYRTLEGKWVKVIAVKDETKGYETVQCDDRRTPDGGHRYNRTTHVEDNGRCTGTAHDFSDPRNLCPVIRINGYKYCMVLDRENRLAIDALPVPGQNWGANHKSVREIAVAYYNKEIMPTLLRNKDLGGAL